MGIVKYSPIIDEIAGKIGNVIFQRGPGSARVRQRTIPANPQTTAQTAQRSLITTISKAWGGLSDAQRTAWDAAAATDAWRQTDSLGTSFYLSGEQLYLQLNLNLELAGQSQITAPPAKATFPTLTLGALTMAAGTPAMSLAYTGTLGSGKTLVLSASTQVSQGVMSSKSVSLRVITTYSSTSPINLLSAYTAKFGALVVSQKVYVKMEIVDDASGEKVLVGTVSGIVGA